VRLLGTHGRQISRSTRGPAELSPGFG
jgi:hypothetical protein